jgi:hypothetical protein
MRILKYINPCREDQAVVAYEFADGASEPNAIDGHPYLIHHYGGDPVEVRKFGIAMMGYVDGDASETSTEAMFDVSVQIGGKSYNLDYAHQGEFRTLELETGAAEMVASGDRSKIFCLPLVNPNPVLLTNGTDFGLSLKRLEGGYQGPCSVVLYGAIYDDRSYRPRRVRANTKRYWVNASGDLEALTPELQAKLEVSAEGAPTLLAAQAPEKGE